MEALRDLDDALAGPGPDPLQRARGVRQELHGPTRSSTSARRRSRRTRRSCASRRPSPTCGSTSTTMTLDYVEQFPLIVHPALAGRQPAAGQLPARLPQRATTRSGAEEPGPRCSSTCRCRRSTAPARAELRGRRRVRRPRRARRAARAGHGAADQVRLDTLQRRSAARAGARTRSAPAGSSPAGPARARRASRSEQPGRYRAWIAGSFGRADHGGRRRARDRRREGVNTVGQWHEIGDGRRSRRGAHELSCAAAAAALAPGDGFSGELGPLVLERVGPRAARAGRAAEDAERRLCGRQWDWIERVRP